MDLYRAYQKIKALVQVFEEWQIISGPYYKIVATAAYTKPFKGVSLHKKDCKNDPPIDTKAFYKKLKESYIK